MQVKWWDLIVSDLVPLVLMSVIVTWVLMQWKPVIVALLLMQWKWRDFVAAVVHSHPIELQARFFDYDWMFPVTCGKKTSCVCSLLPH